MLARSHHSVTRLLPVKHSRSHSSTSPSRPHRSRVPTPSHPAWDPTSLRARFIPFPLPPTGAMGSRAGWDRVLEDYAKLKSPERELPPGVWVTSDEKTLTIFDGYEKAKYHLLILPRAPFPLESGGTVPASHLVNLASLLKSPHALEVLKVLERQADEVKEMIRDEMEKEEGWSWDVRVGFHAVESMRHVHLHVISSDMLSPKLKNKKHWNSFHPTLGYFLHLSNVIREVENGGYVLDSRASYEALLKEPLVSTYPPYETFKTIPDLQRHLQREWEKEGRTRKQAAGQAESNSKSG
ncbi:HIT-like domain-containing protein [Rhodotorula toruloides]|uniref:HIT-like domain-containing protein n=2 Tax=Rhodotorula toruloides TaxID=5286 RepID=A0A2T0A033_RHOTO|nr:HIT-like domain-containing protein [Rhodotorula toruloides]PRQ71366.1 HIT-like domain-containing protein [Rhodotorula toruloides]